MSFKKIFLVITFLAVLIAIFGINTPITKAITAEELLAEINRLQAQIAALQEELKAMKQVAAWCHDFNINLKFGDSGQEVAELQRALFEEGFYKNEVSGEFDESTASAVVGFQEKYKNEILIIWGLEHGTGFVGKTTRVKLNSLYGCGIKVKKEELKPPTIITPYNGEVINSISPLFIIFDVPENYVAQFGVWEGNKVLIGTDFLTWGIASYTGTNQKGPIGKFNWNKTYTVIAKTCIDETLTQCSDWSQAVVFTISPKGTCSDSDQGKNYQVKGYVSFNSETAMEDVCLSEIKPDISEKTTLMEYYCTGDQNNPAWFEEYKCPNGCQNGACINPFPVVSPSITVISPNGGEILREGERGEIKFCGNNFSPTGPGGFSHIYLIKGNSVYGLIYKDTTSGIGGCPGNDLYYWTIGKLADGSTVPTGNDYKIKIDFITQSGVIYATGQSKNYFGIDSLTPTCTDSDGGKNLYVKGTTTGISSGSDYPRQITMTDKCADSTHIFEYYCSNNVNVINGLFGNYFASSTQYCADGCIDGACKQTSGVCGDASCSGPETCTTCQVDCGICVPPAPILSPTGGETWQQGTSQVIHWTSYGSVNSVIINLYLNGIYQKSLTGAIPDSGAWTWNIPIDQTIGSQYSIRVSRLSYPRDYIAESGYFSIIEKPSITILTPNGGESWTSVDKVTDTASGNDAYLKFIKWTGGSNPNSSNSVDAYLEQLISGQYVKIGRILPFGYGSIAWVVGVVSNHDCTYPDGVGNLPIPSDYCWLKTNMKVVPPGQYYVHLIDRITKAEDRSDAPFSIVALTPSITVLSPNGGEKWTVSNTYDITWNSSEIDKLYIGLRCSEGAIVPTFTSTNIAREISALLGKYSWKVSTAGITLCDGYKITIGSESITTKETEVISGRYDESDNYFSIVSGLGLKSIENQLASVSDAIAQLMKAIKELLKR